MKATSKKVVGEWVRILGNACRIAAATVTQLPEGHVLVLFSADSEAAAIRVQGGASGSSIGMVSF